MSCVSVSLALTLSSVLPPVSELPVCVFSGSPHQSFIDSLLEGGGPFHSIIWGVSFSDTNSKDVIHSLNFFVWPLYNNLRICFDMEN